MDPWVAHFHPLLRPYLQAFGRAIVTVTGVPVAVRARADQWEDLERALGDTARRLTESHAAVEGWTGSARLAYNRSHVVAVRRIEEEAALARRTAHVLRAAAEILVAMRREVTKATAAFLQDAEKARQWANTVPTQSGGGPEVAFAQRLPDVYAPHAARVVWLVQQFGKEMSGVAAALADLGPSTVGRSFGDVWDYLSLDVPEQLDRWWHSWGTDATPSPAGGADEHLGLGALADRIIARFKKQHLVTPVTGATSPYLGITIAPADVAKVAAAASVVTARVPGLSLLLRRAAVGALAVDMGSEVTGKQPAVQFSMGIDPDTLKPDSLSARVGLRGAGAPTTLWGGVARAWAWQGDPQDTRLGCMRFDYAATPLPLPHTYSVTGAFEIATLDGKVAAGPFTEVDWALAGKGAPHHYKGINLEQGGATFCGVWVNLAK